MSAAENKKLILDAFNSWVRGDGSVIDLFSDDVKWTVIGSTPVSRAYQSKREFLDGAVKPLTEKLSGAIKPALRALTAEDDRVVLEWQGQTSGKNGKPYYQTYCWVMKIQNGKVIEGIAYLDTELISNLWK
ncbi:MAG TPA: nuclear transport factor 2 family protein [Candidatus Binataceae bacterium]|nr:nuclear transport factor 2 family protein [Candidatus Binataceae bacterium]